MFCNAVAEWAANAPYVKRGSMTTREQIRAALTTLLDPTLPLVHDDNNPNCGECWECIGGTMGVARAMRRSGADALAALDVPDALVYLNSDLAQAQGEVAVLRGHVLALATALQYHRSDMHNTSNRPCSTCAESAKALLAVGVTPFVEGTGMDRQAPITPIRSGVS